MQTSLYWHEKLMWHDTGRLFGPAGQHDWFEPYPHLETVEGKRRIKNLLDASGLADALNIVKPQAASREQILAVHTEQHWQHIAELSALSRGGEGTVNSTTTPVPPGGLDIFQLAAGAAVNAVTDVLTGASKHAYALCRPPGHHAQTERVMGFCYFNNAAIAARHAQQAHGIDRIAFVDIDVHHGNGAEEIFAGEPSVLTLSIHQDRHFPPTTGQVVTAKDPFVNNINIPLPPASGTAVYQLAFNQVILPALEKFQPELIMVPCGFDASGHDPLGRMLLNSEDYRWMTRQLQKAAKHLCDSRLVFTHEGGYAPHLVPFLAHAVLEELSGVKTEVEDPFLKALTSPWAAEVLPHQEAMINAARASLALIQV